MKLSTKGGYAVGSTADSARASRAIKLVFVWAILRSDMQVSAAAIGQLFVSCAARGGVRLHRWRGPGVRGISYGASCVRGGTFAVWILAAGG